MDWTAGLFTMDSEIFWTKLGYDIIQKEALFRQGLTTEAVTKQGIVQDTPQHRTHFLFLVWKQRVHFLHDAAGRYTALRTER